eukprot:symbB.v1.2.001402.t1/scaffold75.1/size348941/8
MAAPQPHYFFIQNPDGTRTQHFGLPPAEYQQVASAPMNMGPPPAGYGQFPPYGGAAPGAPYAGLPQAQSMRIFWVMEGEEAWSVVPGAEQLALHVCTFIATTGLVAITTWAICSRMTQNSSGGAADDYFAGGRSLRWYVVAGSLMLTNLSTEQLVGLNGTVYTDQNLAGIWLEAGAAIAMIITSTVFLPRYMALGLTTTSGFLGERFDLFTRTLGSVLFLVFYVFVVCPFALHLG